MTTKFSRILDLMEADVHASLPDVLFLRGAKHLADHTKTARVVWVRKSSVIGPARQFSAVERSRATEQLFVEAHCRASFDELETLEHALILASKRHAQGSVEFGTVDWTMPEYGNKDAEYCLLPIIFYVPVTEPVEATVVVDQVSPDDASAVPGDGILECGDP